MMQILRFFQDTQLGWRSIEHADSEDAGISSLPVPDDLLFFRSVIIIQIDTPPDSRRAKRLVKTALPAAMRPSRRTIDYHCVNTRIERPVRIALIQSQSISLPAQLSQLYHSVMARNETI